MAVTRQAYWLGGTFVNMKLLILVLSLTISPVRECFISRMTLSPIMILPHWSPSRKLEGGTIKLENWQEMKFIRFCHGKGNIIWRLQSPRANPLSLNIDSDFWTKTNHLPPRAHSITLTTTSSENNKLSKNFHNWHKRACAI